MDIKVKPGNWRLTIGRDTDNDIVLHDPKVSRHHARLLGAGEHYYLCDLESKNGTFIAGMRIKDIEVQDGCAIRMGDTNLNLQVDNKRAPVYPKYSCDSGKVSSACSRALFDAGIREKPQAVRKIVRGRARCEKTRRSFGIRYEQRGRYWWAIDTFELDNHRAASPVFKATKIDARAGGFKCPECGAINICPCNCGEIHCSTFPATDWTICPWCGDEYPLFRGDSASASGVMDLS